MKGKAKKALFILPFLTFVLTGCLSNSDKGTATCPTGFVPVPGNSTLGTSDFCVMKYEAKEYGSGIAISQASGTPWTKIDATTAQSKCEQMSEKGFSGIFDLISNSEWMTIARDIESVARNWDSGTVGKGCLFRGNSGTDDSCGYDGGDPESGTERDAKAKLVLSNGEEIWDFAGNVWEWTDWDISDPGFTTGPTEAEESWMEISKLSGSINSKDIRPTGDKLNSANGMGKWRGGSGGAAHRGGRWGDGKVTGAFSLCLKSSPSAKFEDVGFRCVYRP